MSCNGCRVLRKGCSENCVLRLCLQWIQGAEAQGNATVFVAKFFGRAGLMNFISAVPETQRPSLFRSLLFEAVGRTVNPVNGAVGLMWTGNWHLCQAAVETVLRGGALKPITSVANTRNPDESSDCTDIFMVGKPEQKAYMTVGKRKELDLCLSPGGAPPSIFRIRSPSMNSEESVITHSGDRTPNGVKLLNLFN